MTRINTFDPVVLTDQHLMAEYRELPMVLGSLRRSKRSVRGLPPIPPRYTLNRGHVTFFYNKRSYLVPRYEALVRELLARGYRLDPERRLDLSIFEGVPLVDWQPDAEARGVNAERILQRIETGRARHRYRGEPIKLAEYRDWLLSFV